MCLIGSGGRPCVPGLRQGKSNLSGKKDAIPKQSKHSECGGCRCLLCQDGSAFQASRPGPRTLALQCLHCQETQSGLSPSPATRGIFPGHFSNSLLLVESWMCMRLIRWAKVTCPHLSCKEGWEHKCLVLSRCSGGGRFCNPS